MTKEFNTTPEMEEVTMEVAETEVVTPEVVDDPYQDIREGETFVEWLARNAVKIALALATAGAAAVYAKWKKAKDAKAGKTKKKIKFRKPWEVIEEPKEDKEDQNTTKEPSNEGTVDPEKESKTTK